tara:strand:+ start:1667 stop:2035 length:369 start_codon:yes stop_codon:yes gene_type:complete
MKLYLIPSVCEGKVPFTESQVRSILKGEADGFLREYSLLAEKENLHRVALSESGKNVVSTVFLGADWGFDNSNDEAPYSFETMVFAVGRNGEIDYEGMYTMRSSTWEGAEECHRDALEKYNA